MKNLFDELDNAVAALGSVSAALSKLKFRLREFIMTEKPLDDEVERLFTTSEELIHSSPTKKADRRSGQSVAKKLNKKVQNRQVWTKKEFHNMPYLKDLKYRKTTDGIHQFRYRRDGFNESFNSKSFEVAKKKAYDFIKSIKRTIRTEAEVIRGRTVDYIAQAWFDLKKAHVDKMTLRSYINVYNNHIFPVFGKRSVKSVLPLDLQPFFDKLYSQSGRTCETAKIIVTGFFKYAVANRLCPSNPMEGVIVEKHFRKAGKALSDDQIKRFKAAMQQDKTKYGLAGLIILYTGIRGSELSSLIFDWENGTFTVNNAKLKKGQKANPANLQRTLPIFPALWTLRERIENEEWKIPAKTLTVHFNEHWAETDVKSLRHTFATKAREAGIDNEIVSLWQGHAPGKNVTANTYTHFSMEFQKEQAKKLNNY